MSWLARMDPETPSAVHPAHSGLIPSRAVPCNECACTSSKLVELIPFNPCIFCWDQSSVLIPSFLGCSPGNLFFPCWSCPLGSWALSPVFPSPAGVLFLWTDLPNLNADRSAGNHQWLIIPSFVETFLLKTYYIQNTIQDWSHLALRKHEFSTHLLKAYLNVICLLRCWKAGSWFSTTPLTGQL
jgi:hypothetical protein